MFEIFSCLNCLSSECKMSIVERDRSWLKGLIYQFNHRGYRKQGSFKNLLCKVMKKWKVRKDYLSTIIMDTATVRRLPDLDLFVIAIVDENYEYYDEYYLDAFGRSKRKKKKKKKAKYSSPPVYVPYEYPTRQQGESNTLCWKCHVSVSTYDYGSTDLYKVMISAIIFLTLSSFVLLKVSLNTAEWDRTIARSKNANEEATFIS